MHIAFCECKHPGMINDGDGINLLCHYCRKEVEGLRKSFERQPYFDQYVETQKGVFVKNDNHNKASAVQMIKSW